MLGYVFNMIFFCLRGIKGLMCILWIDVIKIFIKLRFDKVGVLGKRGGNIGSER